MASHHRSFTFACYQRKGCIYFCSTGQGIQLGMSIDIRTAWPISKKQFAQLFKSRGFQSRDDIEQQELSCSIDGILRAPWILKYSWNNCGKSRGGSAVLTLFSRNVLLLEARAWSPLLSGGFKPVEPLSPLMMAMMSCIRSDIALFL